MKRITFAALLLLIGSPAFGAAKRPPITGIEYVQVYAADPATSRDFYTKRLAAPEVPCLHGNCQQYQIGKDQHLEVVKASGHATGMDVIAFRTSDAGALREFLASKGVQAPPATRKNPDGSFEFEVSDPEGSRVSFHIA
jgi:catechol 2,3-dioxygenase-like lactoylglutathione lyase family enzyme